MTAAVKNAPLPQEAATLVQQARLNLKLALDALPSDGQPATLANLHKATGPVLRAGTAIKRAHNFLKHGF